MLYPTLPSPPGPVRKDYTKNTIYYVTSIHITPIDAVKILLLGILILTFLVNLFLYICNTVHFIHFNINLSIRSKTTSEKQSCLLPLTLLILYVILLSDYEESWYFLLCRVNLNKSSKLKLPKSIINCFSRVTFMFLSIFIFYLSNTLICDILCLFVFQNCCHFFF